LRALVIDQAARSLQFFEHRESDVQNSANKRDCDCQRDQFGARINFFHQLPRKFTQKNLGIVTSRSCG